MPKKFKVNDIVKSKYLDGIYIVRTAILSSKYWGLSLKLERLDKPVLTSYWYSADEFEKVEPMQHMLWELALNEKSDNRTNPK